MTDLKNNNLNECQGPNRVVRDLILPLGKHYEVMIGWGIFCLVLGTVALVMPAAFSIGVTIFVGAMMLAGGATGLALFYKVKGWAGKTASVLGSLLTAAAGVLMMMHPVVGTEALTLFIACYFISIGLVKLWLSLANTDASGWGLMLFSALVSMALGGCILWGWYKSAPYMLGLFAAIELIFDGWAALMVGFEVRRCVKSKGTGSSDVNSGSDSGIGKEIGVQH